MATNFHFKVAQIFVQFRLFWKNITFWVKTAVTISWQFLVKIGLLVSLTSGHTVAWLKCKRTFNFELFWAFASVHFYAAAIYQIPFRLLRNAATRKVHGTEFENIIAKNGPFLTSFFFIFVFSKQVTVNKCSINFADDRNWTADLWYQKQPLYQLSHDHCHEIENINLYKPHIGTYC